MARITKDIVTTVRKRNGEVYQTREVQTSTTLGKVVKGAVAVGIGIVILATLAGASEK